LPRTAPLPPASEFGRHFGVISQMHSDRAAIFKLVDKLPPAERKVLPEISETVDGLYTRALDLARTLNALDTEIQPESMRQIDDRLATLESEPPGEERDRHRRLLERQRQTFTDLEQRRGQVSAHLESCVLAMQNMRLDLLKLKSSGVADVMSELTMATQQAKALSRNVDNAIAAAGEIRDAIS
jgi:serine/threonine-protein kinase